MQVSSSDKVDAKPKNDRNFDVNMAYYIIGGEAFMLLDP